MSPAGRDVRFDQLELVPVRPKRSRRPTSDTSIAAAARASTRNQLLRDRVYVAIAEASFDPGHRGATADEVHASLARDANEAGDVRRLMEVRRRVSDLHTKYKKIRDTGLRRVNGQGNPMIVWAPVESSDER